ncbi:DUF3298 domain-containing protein [Vineibacter terrae]|uniref:DUF3298 domain-containing protein n=1 Tax=Vineibacter terrae TaxID=2586908 RepID=A0A5C8PL17_9HYPH|nr:DUF3298 domain-containing protein [Vineibacter terrae]TXL74290.1 DUF3298 domain-containing protein [Vineibacter terrae]
MRMCAGVIGIAIACVVPGASARTGPSFDCAKASSEVERVICGDKDAAAADRKMAGAYRQRLGSLTDAAAREHLQRDQLAWLADRQRMCAGQKDDELAMCHRELAEQRAEWLAMLPAGADYPFVAERRLIEQGRRGGVPYRIAASYPVFERAGVDYARANAAIKGWVDKFAAEMRPPTKADGGMPDIGWFFESGHAVLVVPPRLATVDADWMAYAGGAHPNHGRTAWHVELTTGRLLGLDDILDPASGWQDAITGLVRTDLKKQFEERPGFEEALAPAELRKMVIEPSRWVFADDKVTLTFDPYAVGPYAAGPYEVDLTYQALAPYIRKDGPLAAKAR